ncbi:MAG: lysophospholipid acyltransferase family protein [Bacteroidota bacterium]
MQYALTGKRLMPIIGSIITYLRIGLIALVTAWYSIVVLYLAFTGQNKKYFALARSWSGILLKIAGVELRVHGAEKLDPHASYVFAANHSSLFDIPVMHHSLAHDIRIIYKKELEKIPLFGFALIKSPYISVERTDPRNAMKSIDEAAEAIREGDSVVVFPEGTRSEDGRLGPFKRGAFLLAARAGKPIVPVAVKGTPDIMPKGSKRLKGGRVDVYLGSPIQPPAEVTRSDENRLMDEVRGAIAERLPEDIR